MEEEINEQVVAKEQEIRGEMKECFTDVAVKNDEQVRRKQSDDRFGEVKIQQKQMVRANNLVDEIVEIKEVDQITEVKKQNHPTRIRNTAPDNEKNETKGNNSTVGIEQQGGKTPKESGVEVLEMNQNWIPFNAPFSQTKPLPFSQNTRQQEFWNQQIANEAQDIFKALLPKKIIFAVVQILNDHLKRMFVNQLDEKNLKKKYYKPDQIYEYLGVKILMGYCRMPDPEDYFNQNLPFRNRIGDLMKEGRYKCVEQVTNFNDTILDILKNQRQSKQEYKDNQLMEHLVIPRIIKKINKIQQRACSSQQSLVITKNQYFEAVEQGNQVQCIQLQDAATGFILQTQFLKNQNKIESLTMKMLEFYKQKNHKVYLQRNMLQLEHMNHLAVVSGLYCSGVVKNPDIRFIKGDTVSNGTLMVLQLKNKDQTNILVSAADGFHKYSTTDKRSFATVTLTEMIKKGEQPSSLNDQYKQLVMIKYYLRCQFSCITLSGALFTEVIEIITWNSYIAYKNILKKNNNIEYLDFRLLLAKQLLASKIRPIEATPQPTLPLPHTKTNHVSVQTDKLSSFSSFQPKAPISSFHIPTMLVVPPQFQVSLVCLVCRRPHTQLTQCANCSEVSGKLVSLCPTECFSQFHGAPTEFISQADDLPSLPPATQKLVHQAQFEQSNLAKSLYGSNGSQPKPLNNFPSANQPYPQFPGQTPPPLNRPLIKQSQANQPFFSIDDQNYDLAQQNVDLMDEDDLWDDEQLRRRPGRPKGAKNRAQRLVTPGEDRVQNNQTTSQPKPNNQSYYDFDDERPQQQQKGGKKQVSYSFVGPSE